MKIISTCLSTCHKKQMLVSFLTCMIMHIHQSFPVFYLLRSCDLFNQSEPQNSIAAEQTDKMADEAHRGCFFEEC